MRLNTRLSRLFVLAILFVPLAAGLLYAVLNSQRLAAAQIERDTQEGSYAVRLNAAERQERKGNRRAAAAWRP